MSYWNANLESLQKINPQLVQCLQKETLPSRFRVQSSKSGLPTLTRVLDDGNIISLHSSYNPEREASRFIDSCKTNLSLNFIAGGFGLGYHLLELIKRVSSRARIIVIEKELEILRLAFGNVNMVPLLEHPGFCLKYNIDEHDILSLVNNNAVSFALNSYVSVTFKPLIETSFSYYESLDRIFQEAIQEARINLKTQSIFSKQYYRNIIDNLPHLVNSPGIDNMGQAMRGVPAIIVSAGPSLDKNLPLLKKALEGAFIIAVATAFPSLHSVGISPDIIVAIDPDETSIHSFELNAMKSNSLLLFEPSLPASIVQMFSGRRLVIDSNIFLSRWISSYLGKKGELGKSLSVAHTGYLFAKFLGCSPIGLIGQDLAFYGKKLHCRGSYFENLFLQSIKFNKTLSDNRQEHFFKYINSFKNTSDIFGGYSNTTLAMDAYKNLFSQEIDGSGHVYNATEGGVAIPGVGSLTLKEFVDRFCRSSRRSFLKTIDDKSRKKEISRLIDALNLKRKTLNELKNILTRIRHDFKNQNLDEEEFIQEMESVYRSLIKDTETIRLLQDYAYDGFLQWNKKNHDIELNLESKNPVRIMYAKLKRDQEFLNVLVSASSFIEEAFNLSIKQLEG